MSAFGLALARCRTNDQPLYQPIMAKFTGSYMRHHTPVSQSTTCKIRAPKSQCCCAIRKMLVSVMHISADFECLMCHEGLKFNKRGVSYAAILLAIFRNDTYSLNHRSHGFENFAIFNRRACHWLFNRFAGGDRMSLYCQVASNALHLNNITLIKPINGVLAPVRSLVANVTADTLAPGGAKPSASMAITSKSEVSLTTMFLYITSWYVMTGLRQH